MPLASTVIIAALSRGRPLASSATKSGDPSSWTSYTISLGAEFFNSMVLQSVAPSVALYSMVVLGTKFGSVR